MYWIDAARFYSKKCVCSLTVADDWSAPEKYINLALYVSFLLIASVLLFNLLIAVFSETIYEIGQFSRENWLFQRASTTLLIERRVDNICFRKCLYERTGDSGEDYGFDGNRGLCHFVAFNVVDGNLENPKKMPSKDKLSEEIQLLKSMNEDCLI